MEISKSTLLDLLYQRGYEILLTKDKTHTVVTFSHKTSHPYQLPHSYSLEWSNEDIRKDVVWDLLRWTGLKVKYTLD